jgi:hypothetical protein
MIAFQALLAFTTPVIGLTIPSAWNTPSIDRRYAQPDGLTFRYDPVRIEKEYVAFGDSYAVVIGTGMIGSGGCLVMSGVFEGGEKSQITNESIRRTQI